VRGLELPQVRGLSHLTGTLEDLLADPAWETAEQHYVSVSLTDYARPVDAMRRLRERFPYAVHVEWERPQGDPALRYRERVRGRDDTEIARTFLTDVRGEPNTSEMDWLTRAMAAAVRETEVVRDDIGASPAADTELTA
jgi:exonuclease SbcD